MTTFKRLNSFEVSISLKRVGGFCPSSIQSYDQIVVNYKKNNNKKNQIVPDSQNGAKNSKG